MTAADAIALDLVSAAEALHAVILAETKALALKRPAETSDIGQNKERLSARFASALWRLKENSGILKQIDASSRRRLTAALAELRKAARQNALALLAARDANQRLLDVVMESASKRHQVPSYGRGGRSPALAPGVARPISLFQDQRL
jgi:hypothetical protein